MAVFRSRVQAALYYARKRRRSRQSDSISLGLLGGGTTTADTTPTIEGTLTASAYEISGVVVQVFIDGVAVAKVLTDDDGAWTYTTAALSVAAHAIQVVAVLGGPISARMTLTVT